MRFNIEGEPMPVVVCELESGEMMITEKGAMSWMSPNMQMNTVGGGIGKIFGRMVSGESMFVNTYTAMNGQGTIAFASSFQDVSGHLRFSQGQILYVRSQHF